MKMRWYYFELGSHTHVRVFMNGGKCGDLCFHNREFKEIMALALTSPFTFIDFIPDSRASAGLDMDQLRPV